MTTIYFDDAAELIGTRTTANGYLVGEAKFARTGIQVYAGHELKRPDMARVRVYRPEEEVFHEDALGSFAHRPITDDHPPVNVTAKNWKQYARGNTGDRVIRDGQHAKVPFVLQDAEAIEGVRNGKNQLSGGYEAVIDWTPGKTPQGEDYDAVQRSIRGNHIAIVTTARGGPECRIGDQGTEPDPSPAPPRKDAMATKSIMFDGIQIEVTDQGAQAIEKLTTKLADSTKLLDTRDGEIVGLKKAIETKDGEIAGLKKTHDDAIKVKDAALAAAEANIDKKIEERQTTVADAATVAGKEIDPKGKTVQAIRREAVIANMGDAAVKDRSDDYVEAVFTTLVAKGPAKDALRDGIHDSFAGRRTGGKSEADTAYQDMLDGLNGVAKKEAR